MMKIGRDQSLQISWDLSNDDKHRHHTDEV